MNQNRFYSSKLLLFGEHTVVLGGEALAIPYPNYRSYWTNRTATQEEIQLVEALKAFILLLEQYIHTKKITYSIQIEKLKMDIQDGYFFSTNIPIGYGLGSSGTICAAVYDNYVPKEHKQNLSTRELQKELAQLENIFHGNSSGIDPLVCYLNKGICLQKDNIEIIESVPRLKGSSLTGFLIDTQIKRSTTPLVEYFKKRSKEKIFYENCTFPLLNLSTKIIESYLGEKHETFLATLKHISKIQLEYMHEMIPQIFHKIWKTGLESDLYSLKICGAGGGGLILGFTSNWESTKQALGDYLIEKISF
ncbi:MAG: hypothetical protein MK212_15310 [Saprospiraceae bacterium]|nr:hypothetical protein [Saprospiraceae bacterium]